MQNPLNINDIRLLAWILCRGYWNIDLSRKDKGAWLIRVSEKHKKLFFRLLPNQIISKTEYDIGKYKFKIYTKKIGNKFFPKIAKKNIFGNLIQMKKNVIMEFLREVMRINGRSRVLNLKKEKLKYIGRLLVTLGHTFKFYKTKSKWAKEGYSYRLYSSVLYSLRFVETSQGFNINYRKEKGKYWL